MICLSVLPVRKLTQTGTKRPSSKLDLSLTQIQAAIEDLDPRKNLQSIAASAADILAESELSTKWDDVILMLDSENISERLRLAAHIIFRAKLVLDEMDRNPNTKTIVYNTMLMMDALEVSNLKGYIRDPSSPEYQNLDSDTLSMDSALKKERIISIIKELQTNNPGKGITWLRREASKVLTSEGSTEDRAGLIRTSSNERDFLILECSISEK